jgi:hypothetical protein
MTTKPTYISRSFRTFIIFWITIWTSLNIISASFSILFYSTLQRAQQVQTVTEWASTLIAAVFGLYIVARFIPINNKITQEVKITDLGLLGAAGAVYFFQRNIVSIANLLYTYTEWMKYNDTMFNGSAMIFGIVAYIGYLIPSIVIYLAYRNYLNSLKDYNKNLQSRFQ